MNKGSLVLLFAIFSFPGALMAANGDILYGKKEYVASAPQVIAWKEACNAKKDKDACYNVGVHTSQTEENEEDALEYYRKGCDGQHGLSCFNLGEILIKRPNTRSAGIEAFKKSCKLSTEPNLGDPEKPAIKVACKLVPILEENMKLTYVELQVKLKKINFPTSNVNRPTKTDNNSSKSEAKTAMLDELDRRLLPLKAKDRAQFKFEMELQKNFNSGVAGYCQIYEKNCEGSVCPMCVSNCYSSFYYYRKIQAEKINQSQLDISVKSNQSLETAEKYFSSFAKQICDMPMNIWKITPNKDVCYVAVLKEIESAVISQFISTEENEGEVCAQ